MISPKHNSFFVVRSEPNLMMTFLISRPREDWKYKLQIILNNKVEVNNFINKDSFSIRISRYDQHVKWRVKVYDKSGKVIDENEFWTVKIVHKQGRRRFKLDLDRHSLMDKLHINWDEQDECSSYDVIYNGKKLGSTKNEKITIREKEKLNTVKIACTQDDSIYGMVELKEKKYINHGLLYQFDAVSFSLQQELDASNAVVTESETDTLLHVHGLGYQVYWGKNRKNDLMAFIRWGIPFSFDGEIKQTTYEVRLRYHFFSGLREKLLVESETTRLGYTFGKQYAAELNMSFLSTGFETYFHLKNKILKTALLFKKELSSLSLTPSFKLRFELPQTKNLSWTAEIDIDSFDIDIEAGSTSGETTNEMRQLKLGFLHSF